jgi:hypothetical protein
VPCNAYNDFTLVYARFFEETGVFALPRHARFRPRP